MTGADKANEPAELGEEKWEASERTGKKKKEKGMHKINNISDTPQ